MRQKKLSPQVTVPSQERSIDEIAEIVLQLHKKISASAVLNGGFDAMMLKVDALSEDVKDIKTKIYEPDDGIFARIKSIEVDTKRIANDVARTVDRVEVHDQIEDDVKLQHQRIDMLESGLSGLKTIEDQQKIIDDLVKHRDRVNSVLKWVGVSLGGAVVSLLFKFVYDLIQGHVSVH